MTATLAPPPHDVPPAPIAEPPASAGDPPVRPGRMARLVRGRPDDARWVRPALLGLLVGTAVLYLWGLGASGWANSFYSAAVQAGTHSWKAFFFGSSDASNFITVDKTPGALWVMELSTRLFGVNAWAILVPQALEGVAAVGLLYATIRRWFTPAAGLLAGLVLALTPVATLIFRFNNPDALLVLALVGAAYALTRALERASTRWLALTFGLVGFAFLAKMLQAFLVVPVFGLTYLVAAPTGLWRRVRQLAIGAVALVVSSGWWVAIVELIPKADRPYIGGSQDNSVWNLLFGYNGFGRLTGHETGSVGGGGNATTGQWGATGWSRLFNSEFGGQASWLIPAAVILLVAGLVWCGRRPRTDRTRAALAIWGGWLLVTAVVFSFSKGIIHPYYTVALAPAIGAVIGIGATTAWARRADPVARTVLATTLAATAAWATVLFHRSPSWHPELADVVLIGGLGLALVLLLAPRMRGRVGAAIAAGALAIGLAGPAAASVTTAATTHSGAIPSAGPAVAGAMGGPGGGGARAFGGAGRGGFAGGGGFGGGGGGIGGLLDASTPSASVVRALQADHAKYTWVAAAVGSNEAAGYQLATGDPVMAIGGFNGSDPAPTLAQFQALVKAGRIHWFVATGGGVTGLDQSSSTSTAITNWVTSTFRSTTVGQTTLYDLTSATSS